MAICDSLKDRTNEEVLFLSCAYVPCEYSVLKLKKKKDLFFKKEWEQWVEFNHEVPTIFAWSLSHLRDATDFLALLLMVFCSQVNSAHYSSGECLQCKSLTALVGELGPPYNIQKSAPELQTLRRDPAAGCCSHSSSGVWSRASCELCAHTKPVFPCDTLAASERLKQCKNDSLRMISAPTVPRIARLYRFLPHVGQMSAMHECNRNLFFFGSWFSQNVFKIHS